MTNIWTAQYRYAGTDRLDVTVKGNDQIGHIFAPTWKMVMDYKSGKGGEQAYIANYRTLLKGRQPDVSNSVEWIYNQEQITLVCFCPAGTFCHRVILAKWLSGNPNCNYIGERRL